MRAQAGSNAVRHRPIQHGQIRHGPVRPGSARLAAVLDFGDLTAGDPATDLAVGWLHFTAAGREEFRAALAGHGLYSPGTWVRARAWAVNYAVLMAGLPPGDPLHGVGVHGIGELLDGTPRDAG